MLEGWCIYLCPLKPFLNSFIHRLPLVTSTKSHICEVQEGVTKSDYLIIWFRWWCVCSHHRCPLQRWESACRKWTVSACWSTLPHIPNIGEAWRKPSSGADPSASLLIPTVLFPAGSQPLGVNHVNALGRPRAPADPISSCQHIGLGPLLNFYCICSTHRLFLILFF